MTPAANALDRKIFLLILVLMLLWLGSVLAFVWWDRQEQQRSEKLLGYHRVTSSLAGELLTDATEMQEIVTEERGQGPDTLRLKLSDHFYLASGLMKQLASLESDFGGNRHAAALSRLDETFRSFEASIDANQDALGLVAAYHLRALQLYRIYSNESDVAVEQSLSARLEDSRVLVASLSVFAVTALLLVALIVRQTGRINSRLSDAYRQLDNSTRIAGLGYSYWSPERQRCLEVSPKFASMFGLSTDDFMARCGTLDQYREWIHKDDLKTFDVRSGSGDVTYRAINADGGLIHIAESSERSADNSIMVAAHDVSRMKETEESLRHSQNMELIGQLTGGVAHDFNNILTVITGGMELLQDLDDQQNYYRSMVLDAAGRGSTLTGHLLAFARKQPLSPQAVSMAALLSKQTDIYRRILPENIDIQTVLADSKLFCLVDPMQLENAVTNLVINARDAMPDGGRLTMNATGCVLSEQFTSAVEELQPGEYVCLSISDTGTGISDHLIDRVFEPFFTMKEVGRGTGLGLSMVYGFAKQSGGHVTAHSEDGEGTTFKLYLPLTQEVDQENVPSRKPIKRPPDGTSVLVVEDDNDVRELVGEEVRGCGYTVHVAGNVADALKILEDARVDILLSDLVLRDSINGQQLAEQAKTIRDDLKVVFMSGYTQNAVVHHGRLDPGVLLLQKPFTKEQLAAILAEVSG